ncbi:MAG: hypothetical protein KatS3mg068_1376 [Candidatus Sericytochromatia bacterium]|nr:MAG: hypothetical protein KatS3mg068_1376 [Candidatus Sericytochromatia bacterium]
MKNIVEKIHKSDIFGIFIENGAGLPVSSKLLDLDGASNTIYFSELPYSKDYSYKKYNIDLSIRSVSAEYLSKIINYYNYLFQENKINTIYASSFQLGNINKSTHGWIAFKYKNTLFYYHLSIHQKLKRKEYINRIGKNALKIIFSRNEYMPKDTDIDIVLNSDLTPNYVKTIESIINLKNNEQFVLLKKDSIERLEIYLRKLDKIVIFKGSFNPVQKAHLYLMKRLQELYKTKPFFMISMNTYEKGIQSIESIIKRIQLLFELGYDVILCNKPYFKSNLDFLRYKFDINKKIIFALGSDTFNRLINYYTKDNIVDLDKFMNDFVNVEFFCLLRANNNLPEIFIKNKYDFFRYEESSFMELSSTQIRNLLKENKFEEIKKFVPEMIYNNFLNLYYNISN